MGLESNFQNILNILNSVTKRPGRSRLEPFGELVDELRRRGLTYRDSAGILAEECQRQVSESAINDFVRVRSRRKRTSDSRIAIDAMIAVPIAPKGAWGFSPDAKGGRGPAENRGPQSSQACGDATARRIRFRPKPTVTADCAGEAGIGKKSPSSRSDFNPSRL